MQPFSNQQPCGNHAASNQQPSVVPVPFTVFASLAILQRTTPDRFCKAVNSLTDASLAISLTRHTETEIRALAKNGTGKEYGVSLTAAGAFCSCPDSLYRGTTCKHAAALALFVLRLPPAEPPAAEPQPLTRRTYQLGDAVTLEGKT